MRKNMLLLSIVRFVDKTRFVDGFLGNEKSTNRVMHSIVDSSHSGIHTSGQSQNSDHILDPTEILWCVQHFRKHLLFFRLRFT